MGGKELCLSFGTAKRLQLSTHLLYGAQVIPDRENRMSAAACGARSPHSASWWGLRRCLTIARGGPCCDRMTQREHVRVQLPVIR